MSYTVNITDKAENDLRAIFSYIAFELESYINAVGQLERLEKDFIEQGGFSEKMNRIRREQRGF